MVGKILSIGLLDGIECGIDFKLNKSLVDKKRDTLSFTFLLVQKTIKLNHRQRKNDIHATLLKTIML